MSKEQERAERRRRFFTHLDLAERAAHFGYWSFDLRDGSYLWSPGMYRLLGEDPETRKPDMEYLYAQMMPGDREVIETALKTAIKTRSSFSYRTHARDTESNTRIIDTQGEVELGEDGRVVVVLGVCHDVTAQVRAEEERERAQAMYRLMTEESGDIIILYSPDSKLLFVSQALERLTGRTVEDIRDGGYMRFIHPDDVEEAAKMSRRPVDGDTMVATWRIRHRDGHYVWLETTIRTIHDGSGPKNVVSVSRDVTQRKQRELEAKAAQARAETANRAKSQFLANMSHELRTPLNAIIGFSDLMKAEAFGPLGNARYESYATLIYDSGQLLLDLITDMLDMAKIEAGKLELNFERVDLGETIGDVVRLLDDRAQAAGVTVKVESTDKLSLLADRRAVKQVVINLLTNAIKFTPSGGQIVVRTSRDGNSARVVVADTGIGIPESALPRLGKPFEQVCDDPNLAKTGTGLGLALVRALTEKHGGGMAIISREGEGTEVTVTFALNPAARAAA